MFRFKKSAPNGHFNQQPAVVPDWMDSRTNTVFFSDEYERVIGFAPPTPALSYSIYHLRLYLRIGMNQN
jgi:hypothetical protein